MEKDQKRALSKAYVSREIEYGVCAVRNTENGRVLLLKGDPKAQENRFMFAKMTKTSLLPTMGEDWAQFGPDAFVFEVVVTLKKKAEQTQAEYNRELELLLELEREKFDPTLLY